MVWIVNGRSSVSTVPLWKKVETSTAVRRKRPTGLNLLFDMTAYTHHSYFYTQAYMVNRLNGDRMYSSVQINPRLLTTSYIPDLLASQAWAKALRKLQNGKFDTATFLGELPETVRWLATVSKEMMDAYLALRRGRWTRYLPRRNRRGRGTRIREPRYRVFTFTRRNGSKYNARLALDGRLAKRYLEWRFAVTPLVNEVGNLMDAWYEQALNPMVSRVAASVSGSTPLAGVYQKGNRQEKVNALGYYTITTSAKALQKWGGINLVHTLWNLVPLSFMVDRFIPIGEFLGNLDAELGVEWKSVSTSLVFRTEAQTVDPADGGDWKRAVVTGYGKGYVRGLTKAATTLPTSLSFDRLDFQTGLDILALTRTIGESLLKR